ncbi:Rotamase [Saitozyma sp. JCM 24511]|nr:Rotamase [Saitozyma sp. JCM 24511]
MKDQRREGAGEPGGERERKRDWTEKCAAGRDHISSQLPAPYQNGKSPTPRRRATSLTSQSVTLHTTLGDLKIEVFCEAVPRTAENFLALAASGTYDNTLFHRNIKGFMVQGGDPSGTGKGGQSIWGKPFADEIRQTLKSDVRAGVSGVGVSVERV